MIHSGHRNRLKTRFIEYGLESFDEHNILEMLLFYSIQRNDTNMQAHRLIDNFENLAGVFDAPPEEIIKIKGVGKNSAALLKLMPVLSNMYIKSRASNECCVATLEDAGRYMTKYFENFTSDVVYVICLDGKGKILNCRKLIDGDITSPELTARHLLEAVMKDNAPAVITADFRSQGTIIPTDRDIEAVYRMEKTLDSMNIVYMDHIITTKEEFISLTANGYIKSRGYLTEENK